MNNPEKNHKQPEDTQSQENEENSEKTKHEENFDKDKKKRKKEQQEEDERTRRLEHKNQKLQQKVDRLENKQIQLNENIHILEDQKKKLQKEIERLKEESFRSKKELHIKRYNISRFIDEVNSNKKEMDQLFHISDEEDIQQTDNDNNISDDNLQISNMNDQEKLEYFNELIRKRTDEKFNISIQNYSILTAGINKPNDEQFKHSCDFYNYLQEHGDNESYKIIFTNYKTLDYKQLEELGKLKDFDADYLSKQVKQDIFKRNFLYTDEFENFGELRFREEIIYYQKQGEFQNNLQNLFKKSKRSFYLIQFSFCGEIIIHEGTLYIEDHLFFNQNITKITIPISVTHIFNNAFDQCHQLTKVNLNCVKLEQLGKNAFANCENLVDINLPKSLKVIEYRTFYNCSKLKKIDFPPGLTKISDEAFSKCESLESVILPPSIKTIGSAAFNECFEIKEVIIPNVVEIYDDKPKKEVEQPPEQEEARPQSKSKSEESEKNVFVISPQCFYKCKKLQFIEFSKNSKITVKKQAFSKCKKLSCLIINVNENIFGEEAFSDCQNLDKVNFIVKKGSSLELGNSSFNGCISLVEVSFDHPEFFTEGKMKIGSYVFNNCIWIKDIKIPLNCDGNLGDGLFKDCCSLKSVVLPTKTNKITNSMFKGCENLSEINIPNIENIKIIGISAFEDCYNLNLIKLPPNLEQIEEKAFLNCKSLIINNLPKTLKEIGVSAFENCIKINQLIIPKSTNAIKKHAFKNCNGLIKIKNINSAITIEKLAFENCSKFEALYTNGQDKISTDAVFHAHKNFDFYKIENEDENSF